MNILYTGARSGIARNTIDRIKKRDDVTILLCVHTEEQLKSVKKYYRYDSNVICFKIDITDVQDFQKIDGYEIDVLIHNAAVGYGGSLLEMPLDKIEKNYETNVFGTISFTQYVFQKMNEQGNGRIIFMASLAGILPMPFLGSYCSTKASLIMIAKVLQEEIKLLHPNMQVILIEPGLYHTGFNQVMIDNKYPDMLNGSYFEDMIEQIRSRETLFCMLFEKKKLDSISKKIEKAIFLKHPKSIYRAPISQVVGAKMYQLFFS